MYHLYECLALKTPHIEFDVMGRFVLRTVRRYLYEKECDSPTIGHFFEHRRIFEDLLSHADLFQDERRLRYQTVSAALHQILSECGHDVPVELLLEVSMKIVINAHGIRDMSRIMTDIRLGHALYLGLSKSDHTCEFTKDYIETFVGNRAVLKAMTDFSVSDSLKVYNHYISPRLCYISRQQKLKERYYFECQCKRCVEECQDPNQQLIIALFEKLLSGQNAMRVTDLFLRFERELCRFPNTNPCKNEMFMRMLFNTRHESVERLDYVATSAIEGCSGHYDRMKALFVLCLEFVRFGANQPDHPYHQKFKDALERGLIVSTEILGENHAVVRKLISLREEVIAMSACGLSPSKPLIGALSES